MRAGGSDWKRKGSQLTHTELYYDPARKDIGAMAVTSLDPSIMASRKLGLNCRDIPERTDMTASNLDVNRV